MTAPCPHCTTAAELRRHCTERPCWWGICPTCHAVVDLRNGRHCCGQGECKAER